MEQNVEEKLLKTLQCLTNEEFQNLKWYLKKPVLEFQGIPVAHLEEAHRCKTVDLMVQNYQGLGALRVTLEVLGKIQRNDLAKDLSEDNKHFKGDLQHEDGAKAELRETIAQMILERQTKQEELRCSAAASRALARCYVSHSERSFQALLQKVRRSQDLLLADIEEMKRSTQTEADRLIQELQQEILQLEKVSQEVQTPSAPVGSRQQLPMIPTGRDWAKVSLPNPAYGRKVASTLMDLEKKMTQEKEKLTAWAKLIRAQEFSKDVTLDPNTANSFLVLSPDRKQVYCTNIPQKVQDHHGRFTKACNVLGQPSCSSGRFYFQVQVEGLASWDLGVAAASAPRRGSINTSPQHGFWTIGLREQTQYRAHGLRLNPKHNPKMVGVFVDYEGARVSFFDVDSADLLHQFSNCSFSEELFPFFSPGCHPSINPRHLVISPVTHDM